MGDQRIARQIAQQHVEAEVVVGHQQFGSGVGGLGHQALADGVGLLLHGMAELHAHDAGIDHQGGGDQEQTVGNDAQGHRHTTLAQGSVDQQEEIIGLDGRGAGHRNRFFG
ncbi:hypothetical protein Q3H58_002509 [Pseudomonas psychrotolerans]|nr:hypothetical protein [Pseudomonas psychrotolerans]